MVITNTNIFKEYYLQDNGVWMQHELFPHSSRNGFPRICIFIFDYIAGSRL